MAERLRTLLVGLGPIGAGIGRLATERGEIDLAGAVDSAPGKAGRPLHELLGEGAPAGIAVSAALEATLAALSPQLVLHATGSYLPDVLPQLLTCARAGVTVVSTCEELSYPWRRHAELAKQLDAEAKAHGATLLGTGVNPGFVMDTLVLALSGVCQRVERVRLRRIVDVSSRRPQLQRKVGMGLTLDEFRARVAEGHFGHVGLQESCWLVAEGLGWRLDALDETIEAVPGAPGHAAGMRQTARGTVKGVTVIEAVVQMSAGVERPRDEIEIEGSPPLRTIIEGGVQGDLATAAVVLNVAPRVAARGPGLITMVDLVPLAGRGITPP